MKMKKKKKTKKQQHFLLCLAFDVHGNFIACIHFAVYFHFWIQRKCLRYVILSTVIVVVDKVRIYVVVVTFEKSFLHSFIHSFIGAFWCRWLLLHWHTTKFIYYTFNIYMDRGYMVCNYTRNIMFTEWCMQCITLYYHYFPHETGNFSCNIELKTRFLQRASN